MTTQHLSPLTMLLSRHTRRREFITLLGGAAAWPLTARAQQPAMPVIGFVRSTSLADATHLTTAFGQGLREAGFIAGQNVEIEYRSAENRADRLPVLVADLVRRQKHAVGARCQGGDHDGADRVCDRERPRH